MKVAERRAAASLQPSEWSQYAADDSAQVRQIIAARTDAPAETLMSLTADSKIQVRRALVANRSCPVEALRRLTSDGDFHVRWEATQHPNATAEVRALAARHGDSDVRQALAQLGDLEPAIAASLVDDGDWHVREQLALATRDGEILERLMRDDDPRVRGRVAWNPIATEDQRRELAHDARAEARALVAACPDTPSDVLIELTGDKSPDVRFWLTVHGHNRQLMKILRKDPERTVADTARDSKRSPLRQRPFGRSLRGQLVRCRGTRS